LTACTFNGDVILEKTLAKGIVNLSKSRIFGNLWANGLVAGGFLSLADTEIKCDADLSEIKTSDVYYAGLVMQGDVYLKNVLIGANFTLEKSVIEGTLDLQESQISGDANLRGADVKEFFITKGAKIKGLLKEEGMKYKEKIDK